MAEAAALYRRIAQVNPGFKDAAYRSKELLLGRRSPGNGKREAASERSWFGNAVERFTQLIGSRK